MMKKRIALILLALMMIVPVGAEARNTAQHSEKDGRITITSLGKQDRTPPGALPAVEILPFGIEKMDEDYINGILKGLNARRKENGLGPLELRDDLMYGADKLAYAMAYKEDIFHSMRPLKEAVGMGPVREYKNPVYVGERMAQHVQSFKTSTEILAFGIGAYERGDR